MKLEVKIPTELIEKNQKLADNIEDIEDKMLTAATDVLVPEVQKNLNKAITGKYETGDLRKSVAVKKRRTKKEKANIVYFKGTVIRRFKNGTTQKVTNNLKAAVLEYGKENQPPRPFLRTAMTAKRTEMISAMEDTCDRETRKYT